ncbi:MAG: terpene cyclase/mutase family protein [Gemmatales bacterium]|nr:terpene cyclase/mutase family protein [Gemmatales bacterium]MDW8222006.1 terpene cyclase/mutase family protein [Gemmatales bacterium]
MWTRRQFLAKSAASAAGLALSSQGVFRDAARAADDPDALRFLARYQECTDRALQWLARMQARDGHWEERGGMFAVPMTGLAGLALLCEGSTLTQGRFSRNIENAVEWLLSRIQPNGLIADLRIEEERHRYMYGHGFALTFLSQVFGEENEPRKRELLRRALERAVEFSARAQTRLGGWGYVSSADGGGFDEGSVTITQLQALRAARDAGIPVPKETIDKAKDYLRKSTRVVRHDPDPRKREAGVTYSLQGGGGGDVRPALTAAGIACMFSAGEYENELAIQWLNFCMRSIPVGRAPHERIRHDEYTHFYYAQVIYVLGEDRHAKMRPDLAEVERRDPSQRVLLKWSRYREVMFEAIKSRQSPDGSLSGSGNWGVGPVFATAVYSIILQLDKAVLPIFQR